MSAYRNTIKSYFLRGLKPLQAQYHFWIDKQWLKDETIPVSKITIGESTLTSGTTINWDMEELGTNAYVVLAHNATLAITNMEVGQFGMLTVKQDGSGGHTLALPAGALVGYDGQGVINLSSDPDAIDTLSVYRSAAGYLWLINKTFTGV